MKPFPFKLTLLLLVICFSCSGDDDNNTPTQEEEAQILNAMFSEIESMATSLRCEDPSDWSFTSFGSKPCGGPIGYIAYPLSIDTQLFLDKVEAHKLEQEAFNQRWGLISDCSVQPQPIGISCENGNAILEF
ncbi:hypothetical protein [Hanstruepera flava]|uniref:hypothetical protein n=1 Tax=Hanstruepera flava TaxID=2930218 RepID=UPI002028D547|nr:hypothetical protein [Hanstruepera flava]